jgi:transposase
VGIDIGKATHHAYVVDAAGTPYIPKVLVFADTHAGYTSLFTRLAEATGPYWLNLYAALTAQGYQVLVLNLLYVKARLGTTLRGTKTDPVDARLLAELLQQEHVSASHVPAADVQGLRDMTRLRADIVAQIGDIKRQIIRVLDRTVQAFATGFTDVCGQAARTPLETWTVPEELAAVPTARLATVPTRLSHGHVGTEKARAVKEAAEQSIGVKRGADALAFELRCWCGRSGN